MPRRRTLLIIDGTINALLGVVLLAFVPLADWLGIPPAETAFYPTILGGVLLGIGFALFLECRTTEKTRLRGLGLGGAIAINLCGGLVLLGWLLTTELPVPLRGSVILWGLAIVLVGISAVELLAISHSHRQKARRE